MLSEKRQKTATNDGEERFVPPSLSAQQLDYDAWLGLKHTHQESSYPSSCNGDGFGYSFGNEEGVGCVTDYFHHHHHHHPAADGDSLILPSSTAAFHNHSTGQTHTQDELGGMGMGGLGKSLFTGLQWEELERQRMVQKCILGSPLAVPPPPPANPTPQFLFPLPLPIPNNVVPSSPLSQNPPVSQPEARLGHAGSGSSSSSDLEPWRCKRTDGKKWRCSRDAAPEQKYCERHAHKSKPRPRSRKHVEIPNISHNNHDRQSLITGRGGIIIPPLSTTTGAPAPAPEPASMPPQFSYEQTRSVVVSDSPWQQQVLMMTSSTWAVNRDDNSRSADHQSKNVPFSYFPNNPNNNNPSCCFMNNNKQEPHQSKKPSSSSLTLSISGGNLDRGNNNNNNNNNNNSNNPGRWMVTDSDDEKYDGVLKVPQWMTTMNMNMNHGVQVPGGPLGEALCLGSAAAKATRGGWNSASPQQHQRRF